jgi:hypothetical protein
MLVNNPLFEYNILTENKKTGKRPKNPLPVFYYIPRLQEKGLPPYSAASSSAGT